MSVRDRQRQETCERKRRYATWDEAEAAAVLVWMENPSPDHANICGAYPCDIGGSRHYHYGHRDVPSRQKQRGRDDRSTSRGRV